MVLNNYSGGSHYSVSYPEFNVIGAMEPNSIPLHKPHVQPPILRYRIRLEYFFMVKRRVVLTT